MCGSQVINKFHFGFPLSWLLQSYEVDHIDIPYWGGLTWGWGALTWGWGGLTWGRGRLTWGWEGLIWGWVSWRWIHRQASVFMNVFGPTVYKIWVHRGATGMVAPRWISLFTPLTLLLPHLLSSYPSSSSLTPLLLLLLVHGSYPLFLLILILLLLLWPEGEFTVRTPTSFICYDNRND